MLECEGDLIVIYHTNQTKLFVRLKAVTTHAAPFAIQLTA